jgi:hypothetical protein
MGARLKVEYPVSRGVRPRVGDAKDYTGQRGAKMRRGADSAGIRTTGQPSTPIMEALSSVPTTRPACTGQPDVPDDGASCPESRSVLPRNDEGVGSFDARRDKSPIAKTVLRHYI